MNAFIIHGSFGSPGENWFPWLKEELEKLGVKVFVPKFPTPEGQSLGNWMKVFDEFRGQVNGETILVAHSLGPAFVLNVLEGLERPVKACFFVAGFTGSLGNPEFDGINKSFADRVFDWEKIRANCGKFFVFYSDNDPYVPEEKGVELARNLEVEPELVQGASHFNEKAGYVEFPLLLERIKSLL